MSPEPDFLRPQRGPHRLAWLACITACAVLAIAALDAWDTWQRLQAPREVQAVPPAPPPTSRSELEARRQLQQAVARLDQPWAERFAALDAIDGTGIHWLALEIGDGGRLRLQGQARESRSAMAAAEALRRQAVFRDALLGRMDTGDVQRFEISAGATP